MTTYLLDVNVLIALIDPANVQHDVERFDTARLLSSAQVTDAYPLAPACAHGGQLATFDRRLVTDAVRGGKKST